MSEQKKNPQLDLFRLEANDRVKRQIANLLTLAERGATEGERKAARKAMERLISKYDLDVSKLDEITREEYTFSWTSYLEADLFTYICMYFLERDDFMVEVRNYRKTNSGYEEARVLAVTLDRLEYITIECAYEYFRRHMKKEYKRLVTPQVKRCRKAKTRKAKKAKLEPVFFERYIIASKLIKQDEIKKRDLTKLSNAELERLVSMVGIEGGEFNQQVGNGLYLEA